MITHRENRVAVVCLAHPKRSCVVLTPAAMGMAGAASLTRLTRSTSSAS